MGGREDATPGAADVARVAARIALAVAAVSLVGVAVGTLGRPGYLVDPQTLIPIRSGSAFVCFALALVVLGRLGVIPIGPRARAWFLATVMVLLGASVAVGVADGFHDLAARVAGHGRLHEHGVPLLSAVCAALLAVAIIGRERDWSIELTDTLACMSFAIAAFILFSWGIGDPKAIAVGHEAPPLFLGAIAFAALAVAVVVADPARDGLGAMLTRPGGAGGSQLRRLAPVALLVPLGLEVARHQFATALGVSLVAAGQVFATAMVLFAFVVVGAVRLDRSERELHAARESAFMSTMSHELRTPLIAIRNLAEVVERSWDDVTEEQKREANRAALAQSTRLLDLVHDTSQLRRLDAGTLPAHPEGVSLRHALRAAVDERGIRVAIECPRGLRVWMDPEYLRLMLGACLRLAQRSGPGPRTLRAVARRDDACIYLEVPSRAGVVAAPPTESSWSLWTIAQLARRWGGDASFERVDEERSRFVVTLPLAAQIPSEQPGFRA